MAGISLEFASWAPFHAVHDEAALQYWLRKVGRAAEKAFVKGMKGYPPASVPGSYPSIRSGRLRASIQWAVHGHEVTIGTNTSYSGYLADGTSKMEKRKMSKEALDEGIAAVGRLKGWAKFAAGSP